ncbi:MAG: D-sedoheptulose 7-phosphate isomerase [Thermodesulfovibrionales bacterium]
MERDSLIDRAVRDNIALKEKILGDRQLVQTIGRIGGEIVSAFRSGRKVLFCGNGGSAADAQHLAAEFSGRFYFDREPLYAEALHVNTSYLTAVANDYSYDEIYARLVRAKGGEGDILIGLSTSGNSANILLAMEAAAAKGMKTVGFTGETGGKLCGLCTYLVKVPSRDTPRIQEAHIMLGHIICEMVERELFSA